MEVTVKKPDSTDVAEQIKPVYNSNVQFWIPEFNVSSKKSFLANRERCPSHKQKDRNEKVQKRIPPYLTYIGDTIDQGATRLGGYRSVYMFTDGGSPFSLGFIIDTNSRSL